MDLKKTAFSLVALIAIVFILIVGKGLLIPFVLALFLWFCVGRTRKLFDKSDWVKNRIPSWIKSIIASFILLLILAMMSRIISSSIKELAVSYKIYEVNIDHVLNDINSIFNINSIEFILKHSGEINFGSILSLIFNSISDLLSNTFMVLLYALFIFLEEAYFTNKLNGIITNQTSRDKTNEILHNINSSIGSYLGLKTIVSFITGILSYLILVLIGIDAPIFWAFLIFILNFIPTIGSLTGTLFPAIFCLLQFGDFSSGLLVLGCVGAVQIVVGNIIEPKIMGSSMNISPLAAIVSLSFWGAIWGITGMIISVPITVVLIIVFSQFKQTKYLAIALSEKGKVTVTNKA